MGAVVLSIDGQSLTAREGQTILDACHAGGIEVPTLCHYAGLTDIGACRLCIVEIDGQRRPAPACTTPVEDKMVIRTHTPALENLRRQTIELLFSERNHICPFCPASGDCELQSAGYRQGMDHVRYDYCFPRLAVDNSHRRISLDHNRCILCTRCIRACDEWIGAHVLDLDHRGSQTMLIADNGVGLGESSCISCGACVSVCPTGALFAKRSSHRHGKVSIENLETICPSCGVGCHIRASVRHRQIIELESAGGPAGNRILCEKGRFGLVEPRRPRIERIALRQGGEWLALTPAQAAEETARRLSAPAVREDPQRVIALLSPRLPLETISAVHSFLHRVVGATPPRWAMLDRTNASAVRPAIQPHGKLLPLAGLPDLEEADMFLLVGCNLDASHGVVASYVRRAVLHRRARLAKINPRHTWLTDWTDVHIEVERGRDALVLGAMMKYLMDDGRLVAPLAEPLRKRLQALTDDEITAITRAPAEKIRAAAKLYGQARRPMLICGIGLSRHGPQGLNAALSLVQATQPGTPSGRWRLMEVAIGANTAGARLLDGPELDLNAFDPHSADVAFVFLADDERPWPSEIIRKLRAVGFVVVLAARQHEIAEAAHLVLPAPLWAQRGGTFVNLEGRVQTGRKLMDPSPECVDEAQWLTRLARAWRGADCAWEPPGLPEAILHTSDGHRVACDAQARAFDATSLEMLTA
jgi:formate dehydrogenase major subunit